MFGSARRDRSNHPYAAKPAVVSWEVQDGGGAPVCWAARFVGRFLRHVGLYFKAQPSTKHLVAPAATEGKRFEGWTVGSRWAETHGH